MWEALQGMEVTGNHPPRAKARRTPQETHRPDRRGASRAVTGSPGRVRLGLSGQWREPGGARQTDRSATRTGAGRRWRTGQSSSRASAGDKAKAARSDRSGCVNASNDRDRPRARPSRAPSVAKAAPKSAAIQPDSWISQSACSPNKTTGCLAHPSPETDANTVPASSYVLKRRPTRRAGRRFRPTRRTKPTPPDRVQRFPRVGQALDHHA